MEIINLTESLIEYLSISSALLVILGLLSFLSVQSLKIQGRAKLLVCTLIIILPLAYPLKTLFPESVKIPVPLELKYFQQLIEVSTKNTISTNTSFLSKNHEAGFIESKAMSSGKKDRFMETMAGLFSNWRLIATIIWGGAFLFFLIRVAQTGCKTNKFLRLADPVTDPKILKLLHKCASETGLRRIPQLFKVEDISTPMVMGFFTPGIIIPRELLKPEFFKGLRFTFLHEMKHLQQHHNWWLLIESIIGAAYFFHPVFHWAKKRIHEEQEHICDKHVIHVTDNSVSYADFLLNQIWQQSSGKNPALALPFVSTVSKTTTRIHSILENTKPTPFMHIRDKISVFMVLLVFPSILFLSITPSVQRPDQSLNMLNPLKINSLERVEIKSDPVKPEKEISFFEESSINPNSEVPSHIDKILPAIKTAKGKGAPLKTIQEETKIEPVPETKSLPIEVTDQEYKAEIAQEYSKLDTIQTRDILGIVTRNNMLMAQSISGKKDAFNKSKSPATISEKYLGAPVNELSISRINDIKILDEFTVLLIMRGENMYLMRLSDPCPGLLYASDFNLVTNNGKISKYDRIQALSHGQVVGTSVMLGEIYPYKYEGRKYEAIKLLKKSLLEELVTGGAFNEFNPVEE